MRVQITTEQVKDAFAVVSEASAFAESSRIVARGGLPVEMLQAMSLRPELLRMFASTGESVYPGGLLERPLKEYVILQASRENACQFCASSHTSLIRQLGIASDPAAQIEGRTDQPLTAREKLALEYTRLAMRDSNRVPDELFAGLREQFTDPEIVELTFLIGFINMLNLFNNCLQVTYRGEYEEE